MSATRVRPTGLAPSRDSFQIFLLGTALACSPVSDHSSNAGAQTDTSLAIDPVSTSSTPTSGPATSSTPTSSAGADDTTAQTETGLFEPRFDVENPSDTGITTGCRKIDFLFVIDNSRSMRDEQANLINSVPGFIATIQTVVGGGIDDFHVMVTDSDVSEECVEWCRQVPNHCEGATCDQWLVPDACALTLGSGRVYDGSRQNCGIAGGRRYITSSQPDVGATFACTGDVGTLGYGSEMIAASMTAALSAEQVGPGGCNGGFLRDDAILVVTFITDEEEEGSPGDPSDWYADVVAAKGGNAGAVVVLGLFGDTDQPDALCEPLDPDQGIIGAEASPRLREFVDLFGEQGSWASVCAPDYSPFFQAAVDLVDTTCTVFEPPG